MYLTDFLKTKKVQFYCITLRIYRKIHHNIVEAKTFLAKKSVNEIVLEEQVHPDKSSIEYLVFPYTSISSAFGYSNRNVVSYTNFKLADVVTRVLVVVNLSCRIFSPPLDQPKLRRWRQLKAIISSRCSEAQKVRCEESQIERSVQIYIQFKNIA